MNAADRLAAVVIATSTLLLGVSCGATRAPATAIATAPPEAPEQHAPAPSEGSLRAAGGRLEPSPGPSQGASTFVLGHATIELGERPPWATILEASAGDPSAASAGDPAPRPASRWRALKTIRVGFGYLHRAELSSNGERVLTLSEQEGALRSYDVATGRLRHRVPLPGFNEFDSVGFATLDERRELVLVVRRPFTVGQHAGALEIVPQLVELAGGTFHPVDRFPTGDDLRFTSRPGLLGVSDRIIDPQSGTLSLWWMAPIGSGGAPPLDAALAVRLSCAERPDDWALSNDGKLLAIAYYPSNSVDLLDLERRQVRLHLPAPQWGGALALAPDSRLLALGGANLSVYGVASGQLLARDAQYGNNIDTIRFTPQADLLLTSAYDGKARSYVLPGDLDSLATLPRPQALSHGRANVYALAMTPDGRRLVTSSGDQTLKAWVR